MPLTGHIQWLIAKLQAIAVTVRSPLTGTPLASTPSMEKYGLALSPLTIWYGMYAPKGTPASIVQRLSSSIASIARSQDFSKEQQDSGVRAVDDERLTPAGHRKHLNEELQRWGSLIKAAGAYAD